MKLLHNNLHNQLNTTVTIEVLGDHCYCQPVKWYNIFIFFALNYGAHAMTIRLKPGLSWLNTLVWSLAAICLPYSHMDGSIMKITSVPLYKLPWNETPLEKARRSSALCIVVKVNEARPFSHDRTVTVFGQLRNLPKDYTFQTLTTFDEVKPLLWIHRGTSTTLMLKPDDSQSPAVSTQQRNRSADLPRSSTSLKTAIGVGQAGYVIFTLIRVSALCGKLTMFGYVSPGFTIVPYATLSLINALSVITTPDYPMQYVVYSRGLEDAMRDGWEFDRSAVVGQLVLQSLNEDPNTNETRRRNNDALFMLRVVIIALLKIICITIPYILMWVMTGFENGESTRLQRIIVVTWLAYGQLWAFCVSATHLLAWLVHKFRDSAQHSPSDFFTVLFNTPMRKMLLLWIRVINMFIALSLVAGTFIFVGQMLQETGECVHL